MSKHLLRLVGAVVMACSAAVGVAAPAAHASITLTPPETVPYTPYKPTIDMAGGIQTGDDYGVAGLINAERMKAGLAPVSVTVDDARDSIGCARYNMERFVANNRVLQHCGYETLYWRSTAVPMPDPYRVVQAWMDSPGHRAALLNRNVTSVGVGWAAHPREGVIFAATMELTL